MSDCLFCKILEGKIPSQKLGESELAIAIADIQPQAPFHALILPKKHVASLNDMTAEDRKNLLPALYDLAHEITGQKNLRDRGYRTVINNQREGGQVVFHLHMHVLAGAPMRVGFGA